MALFAKNKTIRVAVIILLNMFFLPSLAQIIHYTDEHGLSNNKINQIVQDNKGFLWIATDDGLNLFNGASFKIYRYVMDDSASLPDNSVNALFIDKKNKLWVGTTKGGVCIYEPMGDGFKRIPHNDLTNSFITNIVGDSAGNVWIATVEGLNCINILTGEIEKFKCSFSKTEILEIVAKYPARFPKGFYTFVNKLPFINETIDKNLLIGLCAGIFADAAVQNAIAFLINNLYHNFHNRLIDNNVIALSANNNGQVFIGYANNAFSYFDSNTRKFVHYPYNKENKNGPAGIKVHSILNYKNKTYIGYDVGLIDVFDIKSNEIEAIKKLPVLNQLRQISLYSENKLWIASNTNNIVYDIHNKTISNFTEINEIENWARSLLFIDNQNNKWLGSNLYGLYLLFEHRGFKVYNKSNGLYADNVSAIAEDNDKNIWVGYYTSGAQKFSADFKKLKIFVPQPDKKGSIADESVFCILADQNNDTWITNYTSGMQKFLKSSNTFLSLKADQLQVDALQGNDIRSMVADKQNNIWCAVHGGGLSCFNQKNNSFKTYRAKLPQWQKSLVSDWLTKVTIDKNGHIWAGSVEGFSILDPATDKFTSYMMSNCPLPHNTVNEIFIDSKGTAWIGTKGGLMAFNQNGASHVFTTKEGLPNNEIKAIAEDNKGRFWVSTNRGIVCFRAYSNSKFDPILVYTSIIKFDVSDGLSANFFYERAVAELHDGRLLFGSEKGITAFYPDSIRFNKSTPNVYFTAFRLFNNIIQVGQKIKNKVVLSKPIYLTDTITLDYWQNVISFEFVALSYIQAQRNHYMYKLEGFNTDWIMLGNKNEATYTNLSPGTYTLLVKASNNDGVWNENPASMVLIINPPFWKTWWFKALLILSFLAAIILFIRLREYNLKQSKIMLEEQVNKKTIELQNFNVLLQERQEEILIQNDRITEQNEALANYSHGLEKMVSERTEELVKAKEKAEESDRLKTAFLANLSHELRTPLNAIVGFANLIVEEHDADPKKAEFAKIITRNSRMLIDFFNAIIEYAKIEAGIVELRLKPVDVNEFLFNFYNKNKKEYSKALVDSRLKLLHSTVQVLADDKKLEEVFHNLLKNAIKYTDKGFIEIGAEEHTGNKLKFYVKDSGIGISKNKFEMLFRRFVKIEDDQSRLFRGVGLGLAFCSQVVQMMGGEIWPESETGTGTTIYFTLPLADLPAPTS